MEIIEYSDKYNEDVKDLLVELQEHIVSIDKEGYNILTGEYREKYFNKTIEEVKKYEGVIFLAKDDEDIVGLVVGLINNDPVNTYEFRAPKRGRITELVVRKDKRGSHIGTKLLEYIENYFKSVGCEGILIEVFAYNNNAYELYKKLGYFDRVHEMMKKI